MISVSKKERLLIQLEYKKPNPSISTVLQIQGFDVWNKKAGHKSGSY